VEGFNQEILKMGFYDTDGYYWDEDEDAEDREKAKAKAEVKFLGKQAYEILTCKVIVRKNGYRRKLNKTHTDVLYSVALNFTNSGYEIKYAKEAIEVLKKEALTRDDAPRKWRKEQELAQKAT